MNNMLNCQTLFLNSSYLIQLITCLWGTQSTIKMCKYPIACTFTYVKYLPSLRIFEQVNVILQLFCNSR